MVASTITIVSSVWTLAVQGKRLFNNIKRGEEEVSELDKKAKAFAAVIEDIGSVYGSNASQPGEDGTKQNIRILLAQCEKEFKDYEHEVEGILHDRRSKKRGIVPILFRAWKESVAAPTFKRIEDSIERYQTSLCALMEAHQG